MRLASAILVATLSIFTVSGIACGDSGDGSVFDGGGGGFGGSSSGNSSSGFGSSEGGSGEGTSGSGVGDTSMLEAIVRDFKAYDATAATNPDFENVPATADRPTGAASPYFGPWAEATTTYFADADYKIDIVLPTLGSDGVPAYNTAAMFKGAAGRTATTHGETFFQQWYHDTPGFNVVRKVPLQLTKATGGVYSYDSAVSGLPQSKDEPMKGFWPIDDGSTLSTTADGFGNQGRAHNYHFTVELHTKFKYHGTETFTFSGDDDVFVFIAKKLVINIGGIHGALTKEVSLPAVAAELGLVVDQEYPLDFFQAERHVVQSNLRIETTLELTPSNVK